MVKSGFSRADLGIGNDTAPFNLAVGTNFRIQGLLQAAADAYVEQNFLEYKRILDMLFIIVIAINAKVITPEQNKEINKTITGVKILCDEEEKKVTQAYLDPYRRNNTIQTTFKEQLYYLHLSLELALTKKGILTASLDTGDSAMDEFE
jgi:hypothetical protein